VSETEDYAGGDPEIGVPRPKHIVVVVDVVCLEHLDANVPAEPIVGTAASAKDVLEMAPGLELENVIPPREHAHRNALSRGR
jgi:hypothetical protein